MREAPLGDGPVRVGGHRVAPVSDRDGPVKVGELLGAFLEEKGVGRQVRRMDVLDAWPERVGKAIAEVARPCSLSEGTLFVEVRSSSWLMELNMMKGRILERLNEGRPQDARVEKIVFVLAEGG